MKILFKSIVFCLAAPTLLLANLGDNELKISQTYGSPTNEQELSPSLLARHYRFNGMAITVTFLNGTSQCETFTRIDEAPLTDDQIQTLLGENSNHLFWTSKASSGGPLREWVITGSFSTASSSTDPMVLAVSGKHQTLEGTRMIAVDMLKPDADSSSASAPLVLRSAIYKGATTNSVLTIFTSAYERVSKKELSRNNPPPAPEQ